MDAVVGCDVYDIGNTMSYPTMVFITTNSFYVTCVQPASFLIID
jgi:hypothetical protein